MTILDDIATLNNSIQVNTSTRRSDSSARLDEAQKELAAYGALQSTIAAAVTELQAEITALQSLAPPAAAPAHGAAAPAA